jgi:hypothetical protein
MSIRIGSVPLFEPEKVIYSIISNRSNVMSLSSDNANVLMEIGHFSIGQSCNINTPENPGTFVINDQDVPVAAFSKDSIVLYQPITSTNDVNIGNNLSTQKNLFGKSMTTSNLTIYNTDAYGQLLYMESNSIPLLSMNNTQQGSMYIGGQLGIGISPNHQFSVRASSNAYIQGFTYSCNVYTSFIGYGAGSNGISFTKDNILIDATKVSINNLSLLGISRYEDVIVNKTASFIGTTFACNLTLTNNTANTNCLRINQKLIDGTFSSTTTGDPISVVSEFPIIGDKTVLEVSPMGHMVFGGYPSEAQHDYMIRGIIPANRASYFDGFLSFVNQNNSYNTKASFSMNPNCYVAIGTTASTSMLEIKNGYTGAETGYTPADSICTLQNAQITNMLPFLKCRLPNSSVRCQITNKGTLVFGNTILNNDKYDIESGSNAYFKKAELVSLGEYNNIPIDGTQATLSNLKHVVTDNLLVGNGEMSNVIIRALVADSFATPSLDCVDGINDNSIFKILSKKLLLNSSNIVINRDYGFYSCNETSNIGLDSLRLYTLGTNTDTVNAVHIIGNNADMKERYNNTNNTLNAKITQEYQINQNLFKVAVLNRNTLPNASDGASMHITALLSSTDDGGISSDQAAINIFKDKSIKFSGNTYIDSKGVLSIGQPAPKPPYYSAYLKGGMIVTTSINSTALVVDAEKQYVGIATGTVGYNFQTNGSVYFSSNAQPQFTISGNVGIGTQFPAKPFQVSLETQFDRYTYFASNVAIQGRLDTLGNVASTSDYAIKKDLEPITYALDKIDQLTGYTYTRTDTHMKETGLVAQEVLKVLPEAVTVGHNGLYTLAYGNLAGLFVEAIKELKKENQALRKEIESLTSSHRREHSM